MTLIQDIELHVAAAIRDTIGNDLLLGLIALLLIGIALIMIGLSIEAALVLFVPATLAVLLSAGVGIPIVLVLGLGGGVILYMAFMKLVTR